MIKIPINTEALRDLAGQLKAMADETRLAILAMLVEGELCVCEIMDNLPLSQPAVSHHLKVLRQAGLVTDRREGKWIYYSLNPVTLTTLQEILAGMLSGPPVHGNSGPRQSCATLGKASNHCALNS